jgi:CheY-like chemotaxis protein
MGQRLPLFGGVGLRRPSGALRCLRAFPAAAGVNDDDEKGSLRMNGMVTRPPRSTVVLVVDDDPDVLAALLEALDMEGYDVRGARDGIEALEAIRKQRPDLIITDLLMPTMTGFELLAVLHDDPALATIPTLIITAGRSPDASETTGSMVLPKPLDLDRLMRAITACTGERDQDDVSARN